MGAECEVAGRYDHHSGSNSLLHVFLDSGGKEKKMSSNIFWTLEEDEILIDFNCPNRRTGTQKFLPILGQYHPLESFNCNCLIGIGGGKHINSLQFLDDAIHWSPSTVRELGHLVAPTGGERVADACCKRKNCLPGKPY
ncbi:hypothetical protein TNCV_4699421 [Trichonephila clavipes]|nr:hypothetical protein TNCV_4699421 [Trichonephila clavipes]